MRTSAFLPRSKSKIVFVLAMASYTAAAAALIRTIASAFGAQRPPLGVFLERGYPTLEVISLVLLAPIIESLILIGLIELLQWLRSPVWLQLICSATISAALHVPISHALVVAPGWFIMAAAYLMWRRVSWKVGFAVIASIHALLNLNPAISTISYAIRHTKA
jgi:hypothetical protein